MTEVVLEVIPLGLEGIVVLILDLPPASARLNDRLYIGVAEQVGGHPRVVERLLSLLVYDDHLRPIELKCIRVTGQGDAVDPASDVGLMRAAVPHHRPSLMKILFRITEPDPVRQPWMRGRFTDQDE